MVLPSFTTEEHVLKSFSKSMTMTIEPKKEKNKYHKSPAFKTALIQFYLTQPFGVSEPEQLSVVSPVYILEKLQSPFPWLLHLFFEVLYVCIVLLRTKPMTFLRTLFAPLHLQESSPDVVIFITLFLNPEV